MKKKRAKKILSDLPKGFSCTIGSDKDCWLVERVKAECDILRDDLGC